MVESSQYQAKFLLLGEKDSADAKVLTIDVTKQFQDKLILSNAFFDDLLLDKKGYELATTFWIDLRSYPDITEEEAKLLVRFIEGYDERPDIKAQVFKSIKEFRVFENIAKKTKLDEKFNLQMVLEEWYKQNQILLLIDIGGTILYRSGEKLNVQRKVDCQVKKHFHYYRPFHEEYLKALNDHPRVKLAIYTSIMRKNALPLLFKLFDSSKLRAYKSKIFDVFDQEYNVPDGKVDESLPSDQQVNTKNPWATKRKLELVFDEPKVKGFGFTWRNTLMTDSDKDKIRDYPLNSIWIPEYPLEEVIDPKVDQGKILMTARDFIRDMLNNADDVQEYLKEHKQDLENKLIGLSKKGMEAKQPVQEEEKSNDEAEKLSKELEKKLEIKD